MLPDMEKQATHWHKQKTYFEHEMMKTRSSKDLLKNDIRFNDEMHSKLLRL